MKMILFDTFLRVVSCLVYPNKRRISRLKPTAVLNIESPKSPLICSAFVNKYFPK